MVFVKTGSFGGLFCVQIKPKKRPMPCEAFRGVLRRFYLVDDTDFMLGRKSGSEAIL